MRVKYLERTTKFKSYYVVWKLAVDPPVSEDIGEFKSYYVVWKQKYEVYIM